jgi:SNF2 family DNA or RNA helicase
MIEMYEHQKVAFNKFKDMQYFALFHEMGVGKSATSLFIAENHFKLGRIDSCLIIAPNNVHVQWFLEQVPKWITVPFTLSLYGGGKRWEDEEVEGKFLFRVVNIETFSQPTKWHEIRDWLKEHKTMIILDEATSIKRPESKRSQNIMYGLGEGVRRYGALQAYTPYSVVRCVLTGTPVTNAPMDLWPMFEFLNAGFFGMSYKAFKYKYSLTMAGPAGFAIPVTKEAAEAMKRMDFNTAHSQFGVELEIYNYCISRPWEGPYRNIDELRLEIDARSSFVKITECHDMPERIYIKREVYMADEQSKAYYALKKDMLYKTDDAAIEVMNKLVLMLRFQQITAGFLPMSEIICDDEGNPIDFGLTRVEPFKENPKLDMLLRDVEALGGKQAIIFCHFSAEAEQVYNALTEAGYENICLQTGWKKVGNIQDFQQGSTQLIVANLRVLSKGFNLQNAHIVMFYGNTFSAEDRLQAEARTFRIGQTEPCLYYDYTCKGTVDEKIVASLIEKRHLLDYITSTPLEGIV